MHLSQSYERLLPPQGFMSLLLRQSKRNFQSGGRWCTYYAVLSPVLQGGMSVLSTAGDCLSNLSLNAHLAVQCSYGAALPSMDVTGSACHPHAKVCKGMVRNTPANVKQKLMMALMLSLVSADSKKKKKSMRGFEDFSSRGYSGGAIPT